MEAAVTGLCFGDGYYRQLAEHYNHMKELFTGGLRDMGFHFTEPQGAYYVLLDVSEFGVTDDLAFCEWLAREVGVGAVPGSSFFKEEIHNYIRFHFAKKDERLLAALDKLKDMKKKDASLLRHLWCTFTDHLGYFLCRNKFSCLFPINKCIE